MKILIYGACTKLPKYNLLDSFITVSKFIYYGFISRIKNEPIYNYKEFVRRNSYNTGDFFISHTIEKFVEHEFGTKTKFYYKDWQENIDFKNYDLVIISGGGYFYFDSKSKLPCRIKSDLSNLVSNKINYVLFGVGINSNFSYDILNISLDDQQLIKQLVESSIATSVRDFNTHKILTSLTNSPIDLIGDPALHISNFYKHSGSINKNIKSNIGFNIPLHGKTVEDLFKKNFSKILVLLTKIGSNSNVSFISHSQSSRAINIFLLPFIGYKKMYANSITDLLYDYSRTDIVISGKLHCCIIAFSYSIPAIALAYDIKHKEFFRLFDLEELVEDLSNIDSSSILSKIDHIMINSDNIKLKISDVRQLYYDKTIDFVSRFHKTILSAVQEQGDSK